MLSAEQNDLITQTGSGTPAGQVLRRYWQPVALSEELVGERPLTAVTLLGEQLVLFRDERGSLGLIDRHCPHRGADLCFGRLEDGGLRCPFHGWLFDTNGHCLEQPGEPQGSLYFKNIQQNGYPCIERNGIIFAFMGGGQAPALPQIDCFEAPEEYTFAFKGYLECNWLQALEVGIDPVHASFLHRYSKAGDPGPIYGQQFRDTAGEDCISMTTLLREFPRPQIEVDRTEYGLRLRTVRDLGDDHRHVRVTNQLFPQAICIPMSSEMNITQWHVPIDDRNCYWYALFTSFKAPVDQEKMRSQRLELYQLPDYRARQNKTNDYGYDPQEQRTRTYTGMGDDINVHDQWAVESMGAIQDRTREHLGRTDVAIREYRKLLLQAITDQKNGCPLDHAISPTGRYGPEAVDAISSGSGWQDHWLGLDRERRVASPWNAVLPESIDQAEPGADS
ncbi:MAG: aromatic ring-hydroxylating dioxygenase subunit alpha [Gammaproteobacteria bacterium]|nr:aromatic ring-hydroxylating dioxygenase subunit alpha [Gammaproteobacteria bacterium]